MSARITVIGAGLMGHGIALVFARAGHDVAVYDAVAGSLDTVKDRVRASLRDMGNDTAHADRITAHAGLADAVAGADLVVEAVREDLAIKQALFAQIEAAAPPDAVLASNTSVISITRIMEGLQRRERAIGTHWWNPPFLIPLVEVIATEWTAPACVDWTMALHRAAGKTPVHVKRDVPGFIGNRLQHALWREAIHLVQEGVCDAETVDTVVKASFGRRLAVLGPIENMDLVGTELTADIHHNLLGDLDRSVDVQPYLAQLIADGRLGFKSGRGFRDWTPAQQAELRALLVRHLMKANAEEPHDA